MEAQATFKNIRCTPRKLRLVVDQVRGKKVEDALNLLKFERKVISKDVAKLIRSAVANATQKGGVRADTLFVKKILVNPATIMKRIMPRARGSASSLYKRMSHIHVVVGDK
ncbi:50S ribosomal protein L22 [bacterium]|nr:50S ribosomal protein L22 [bacterium]